MSDDGKPAAQFEPLLHGIATAVCGVNGDWQEFQEAIGLQPLDQPEPVIARKFQLGEDEVDADVRADESPSFGRAPDDRQAVTAAREDPLHGALRHLAGIDKENTGHGNAEAKPVHRSTSRATESFIGPRSGK